MESVGLELGWIIAGAVLATGLITVVLMKLVDHFLKKNDPVEAIRKIATATAASTDGDVKAMLTEIRSWRSDFSLLDKKIGKLVDKLDEVEGEVNSMKVELARMDQQFQDFAITMTKTVDELKSGLAGLRNNRREQT